MNIHPELNTFEASKEQERRIVERVSSKFPDWSITSLGVHKNGTGTARIEMDDEVKDVINIDLHSSENEAV